MENKKFEYDKALEELEKIAAKVESPDVSLAEIDAGIKRSEEILKACREWLRGIREHTGGLSD